MTLPLMTRGAPMSSESQIVLHYPVENAIQDTVTGCWDIFFMKLDPAAKSIPFSSFLGGSDWDGAYSIALDSNNVYLAGTTSSPDFPVTAGAYQMIPGSNRDAFVAKISLPRERVCGGGLAGYTEP